MKTCNLLSIILVLLVAGCFQNADQTLKQSDNSSNTPVSMITSAHFSGALVATNKVTGIQISWISATAPVSVYKVYRMQGRKLNLVATLPDNVSSFIDGDVTWGSIYNYVVKAVDTNGIEDTNTKTVSSLAWGGISSVSAESRESIKVAFDSPTPVADEIRIYLTSKNTKEKKLVATLDGSATEHLIENLNPGYSYYVSAQAYVSSIKKEDGNEIKFEVATETVSYHSYDTTPPAWQNVINIRAFGESPNSPTHPSKPEKNPKNRVVELAFNPFLGADPTTKYVVIRAGVGQTLDTSTQLTCTENTSSACKVCELTGNSDLFCRDTKVAAAPAKYRYTMALVRTDSSTSETWIEPIPQDKLDQFTVTVPIPPANMVLMHRAAANYEMCKGLMNQAVDPMNYNRCAYPGIGGSPYSTGHNKPPLNLPKGYYDSGFNLFIDRYPLACNWTKATFGGMCGAGATTGDCIGPGVPSSSIGKEKDVFFRIDPTVTNVSTGATCYIKRDGAWTQYDSMIDTKINNGEYLRAMFTINPKEQDGHRPLTQFNLAPATTNEACKAFSHPTYGAKRIMRLREYRLMKAMPTMPGEPYAMTYNTSNAIRYQTTVHSAATGFGCDQVVNDTHPSSLSSMLDSNNEIAAFMLSGVKQGQSRFFIGSTLNIDCQSRYGLAHNFSMNETTSDYFDYDGALKRYTGQISPVDNGNRDLLTDINGGNTGFRIENLTPTIEANNWTYIQLFSGSGYNFNVVALSLGLPITGTNPPTGYYTRNAFLEGYYNVMFTYNTADSASNSGSRQITVGDRWQTNLRNGYFSKPGGMIRCVLPAE